MVGGGDGLTLKAPDSTPSPYMSTFDGALWEVMAIPWGVVCERKWIGVLHGPLMPEFGSAGFDL